MKQSYKDKYIQVMEEIKRRTEVVKQLLSGDVNVVFKATTLESAALQIRIILELIAMSSLVANQNEYAKIRSSFHKDWNAKHIANLLEAINPNFYPEPIIETPSAKPGHKSDLLVRKENVLSKSEFINVYDKCGSLLHSDNPLGRKSDYSFYETNLAIWIDKIVNLLKSHKIQLVDHNDSFYLVHMQEKDGKVHMYEFKKKD